jgi:Malectin domain
MYFKEPNKRVFNVKLGSCTVLRNVDCVAKVGPFAANDEYVEFELREDQIFFNNQPCEKAYRPKKNQLVVEFEKGEKDLPIVDGIVLYDGGIEGIYFKYFILRERKIKKWRFFFLRYITS